MFNKLLSASSTTNQGTLFQMKNDFGHCNVTSDVMNCFNYAKNFVRLVEAIVYFVFTTNKRLYNKSIRSRIDRIYYVHVEDKVTFLFNCMYVADYVLIRN